MRKHKIRHLFHLVVDFIPLLLIPVFMIYSHRHDLTQSTEVDIQYKYQSNEVNSADDLIVGNLYELNLKRIYNTNQSGINGESYIYISNHTSVIYVNYSEDVNTGLIQNFSEADFLLDVYFYDSIFDYIFISNDTYGVPLISLSINKDEIMLDLVHVYLTFTGLDYLNFHNKSYTDYWLYFLYTDYNVIEGVSVNDVESDIMSQFTYSMYTAVTKYFNMDEVINLGAVHTWITDNVFNGNMPMGVTIVWHLICYQFVVDLIFLIYGLFMFIIDFADKCMTSFYDKSFGGGR